MKIEKVINIGDITHIMYEGVKKKVNLLIFNENVDNLSGLVWDYMHPIKIQIKVNYIDKIYHI
jgi:hypothetical protein